MSELQIINQMEIDSGIGMENVEIIEPNENMIDND